MGPQPCPDRPTLQALLDDALPADRQGALAEHLDDCAACRARLDELAMPPGSARHDDEDAALQALASARPLPRDLIDSWRRGNPTNPGRPALDATSEVLGRLEPARLPDELGRLGSYRVLRVLGQGGMGVVLLAEDPALGRPVAVKLMRPELAAHPEARERFLREARSAAAVRHEGVVVIHAVEGGDPPYLVMEYVEGRSLQQRIEQEGPLPADEVARLGAQVAEGLAAAHACGLVHRDVKPANILLDTRTGRARLTDFGLARGGDDPGLTQIGFVAGTPDYIAPEQAAGRRVDPRADIYSLGATLLAALAGSAPASPSTLPSSDRPSKRPQARLRGLASRTPAALSRLIESMLAHDPDDRPRTAEEVAKALRTLVGPGGRARPAWRAIAAVGLCAAAVGAWVSRERLRDRGPIRPGQAVQGAPVPASDGPFLLDGAGRFGTLADAVAASSGDAVVEIDGDGPYPTPPIHLGRKALTLRAAPGARPLLVLVPDGQTGSEPVLASEAALTLEGIGLRSEDRREAVRGEDPATFAAIVVRGGPFRAAHCRFEAGPRSACLALARASGRILACQFSGGEGMAISWAPDPGQSLKVEQSLLSAGAPVAFDFARSGLGPGEARLRIDRSTLRALTSVRVLTAGNFLPSAHPFLRIRVERSVLDAAHVLALVNTAAPVKKQAPRPLNLAGRQLRNYLVWGGRDNLYPKAPSWLSLASKSQPLAPARSGPTDLDEWGRFWGRGEPGSAAIELGFPAPRESPSPADHALVVGSAGEAGPPGEPRGADVGRVGPGPAYDAWRASASYEAWREQERAGPGALTGSPAR
jgi:hypothetical protein